MKAAKYLPDIIICSWAALGFYRGAKQYSYNCDVEIKKYAEKIRKYAEEIKKYDEKNKKNADKPEFGMTTKPKFMTTSCIFRGFMGTALYLFPCTMPFVAYKEIYRLEMNIRGIDEDINSTNYYDLIY